MPVDDRRVASLALSARGGSARRRDLVNEAERFFHEYATWRWRPGDGTEAEAHQRRVHELAAAEARLGSDPDMRVRWEREPD